MLIEFATHVKQLLKRFAVSRRQQLNSRRVVIEKPFGSDLKTARELNDVVESVFPPDSVFRIDHYLGKETVQNILALRFANQLYEPLWNSKWICSGSIRLTPTSPIATDSGTGLLTGMT